MLNNVASKNDSSITKSDKNKRMTMRELRLRINKKRITKKNQAKQKFSVILTKEEIEQKVKYFKKLYGPSSSFRICLQALNYNQFQRTIELNNMISYYLKSLKNFKHILSDLKGEEFERVLFFISSHLTYEKYNKNEIICKFGEKADKYYIILKGKMIFLVPKLNKHYMTEEEYIEHLMKLREYQEVELIKNIISNNQYIYFINSSNNNNILLDFDEFIFNALDRHENHNENKYSNYLYTKFKEYKANREKEKNNVNNDKDKDNNKFKINISSYEEYIQLMNVDLKETKDNNKISKKKKVNIFEYGKTNIYSDGDTFGSLGISTKKGKRTATCICYENCHFGILGKEEYLEFFEKIYEKANNKLYDLVIKNKIFDKMTKIKFVEKYSHMFRYVQYNKNNMIINENEKLNSLIILYEGEFTLSVNLNLFELNELIVEYKKIKEKLELNGDRITKNHKFNEIEENKKLLFNMKNSSKDINDIITGKQDFIISNINNFLILGYPNTVNIETSLCLINCKCTSTYANGYIIDKEMLHYIDRENNYKTKTPELIIPKIDLIIKRLYDFKELIMKKIRDKKQLKEYNININDNNNQISRNLDNNKTKNISNLFDFNNKIISPKLSNNKLYISQNDFKDKNNTHNNYYSELKKNISKKEILLDKTKHLSHKFLLAQKIEAKKVTLKSHNIKNNSKYNDLSILFSHKPQHKKTILDELKGSPDIDNILDPKIKRLKKNIRIGNTINLKLIKNKDSDNDTKVQTCINMPDITNKTTSSLYNVFHENIKTENKFNSINDTFSSFYANKTSLSNLDTKYISQSSGKTIPSINLNDRHIKSYFNDYQDSYNELYYKYILDKLKNEKINEKSELNIDGYKSKNFYTSPNKYIFPSISPYIQEKEIKKENLKKYKYKYIDKYKNTEI